MRMRELSIIPVSKPRMTQRDRWAKRPVVVKYHAYCDELRTLLWDYTVPSELGIVFNLPMPKTWSIKKKLTMNGTHHQQKPDIDNLVKAFLDALCEDDSHVYKVHAEKRWSSSPSIGVYSL